MTLQEAKAFHQAAVQQGWQGTGCVRGFSAWVLFRYKDDPTPACDLLSCLIDPNMQSGVSHEEAIELFRLRMDEITGGPRLYNWYAYWVLFFQLWFIKQFRGVGR